MVTDVPTLRRHGFKSYDFSKLSIQILLSDQSSFYGSQMFVDSQWSMRLCARGAKVEKTSGINFISFSSCGHVRGSQTLVLPAVEWNRPKNNTNRYLQPKMCEIRNHPTNWMTQLSNHWRILTCRNCFLIFLCYLSSTSSLFWHKYAPHKISPWFDTIKLINLPDCTYSLSRGSSC